VLRILAADRVVAEDPALAGLQVVSGEQRHDGQALHRHAQVAADERGEPVRLAVQGELDALDLLVVLQLDLEQFDHLHRDARGARDPHGRVLVRREHLLDIPLSDHVSRRRTPVTGHQHATRERHRHDRGPVRHVQRHTAATATSHALRGSGSPPPRQVFRVVRREELGERRRAGLHEGAAHQAAAKRCLLTWKPSSPLPFHELPLIR